MRLPSSCELKEKWGPGQFLGEFLKDGWLFSSWTSGLPELNGLVLCQ